MGLKLPGRALTFAGIAGALAWAACSIYGESLLTSAPADAGDEVTSVPDAGDPDADTCAHARSPARPTIESVTDAGNISAVSALEAVDFGVREAGAPPDLGYDLDSVCTCPGPESCKPTVAAVHCDGDGGRDNAAGALIRRFNSVSSFFDQSVLNQRIQNGLYGFIVRVDGYNGGLDDANVQVSFYTSNGMDGVQNEAGVPNKPKFDGTDRWTLDPGSLFSGGANGLDCGNGNPLCLAKYIDPNAYVANGVVVASIDSISLSLGNGGGVGSIGVDLTGGIITGTVQADGNGGYHIDDGLIVGRWATRNLLTELQILHDPLDPSGGFLCGDSGTYQTIKQTICQAADIFSLVAQDNTGAPCDSLSIAVGFRASAAKMGVVVNKGGNPQNCGPTWHDECK